MKLCFKIKQKPYKCWLCFESSVILQLSVLLMPLSVFAYSSTLQFVHLFSKCWYGIILNMQSPGFVDGHCWQWKRRTRTSVFSWRVCMSSWISWIIMRSRVPVVFISSEGIGIDDKYKFHTVPQQISLECISRHPSVHLCNYFSPRWASAARIVCNNCTCNHSFRSGLFCTWLKLTTRLTTRSANHRLEFHG